MDDTQLRAVLQRLDRLERANRWWRGLSMVAVAMIGLGVLLGATRGKEAGIVEEVRAKQFTVIDASGNIRVVLGQVLFAHDAPNPLYGLVVFDPNLERTVTLYDYGTLGGATLNLGGSHSSMSFTTEKAATLNLETYKQDRIERNRLLSRLVEEGFQKKISWEEYGNRVAQGVTAISISSEPGKPSVILADGNRNARAVIGYAEMKERPTGVVEQRPASSILLLNEAGNAIWKAP